MKITKNDKTKIKDLQFIGTKVITPAVAEEMLKHNSANRKVNKARVHSYADDMKHNNWDSITDGCSITFDKNGNLLNGQHRLNAIIESGISVEMFIFIKDIDASASLVPFDMGLGRSISCITDKPAYYTGTINCILKICNSENHKISVYEFERFEKSLTENQLRYVEKIGMYKNRGFTVNVKSAFILRYLLDGVDESELFESIKNKDYENPQANKYRDIINDFISAPKGINAIDRLTMFFTIYGLLSGLPKKEIKTKQWQDKTLERIKQFVTGRV